MTKDFYLDCIKVLEALSKKDDFEEDLVLSLSPKYGQAIFCKLEQEGIIDSTKDGWFVDDPDKLHLFLDECQSEISELSNKDSSLRISKRSLIIGIISLVVTVLLGILGLCL